MKTIAPHYRSSDGTLFEGPQEATVSGVPSIDLSAVACLFTNPSLLGEVTPDHLWRNVRQEWEAITPNLNGFASTRDAFNAVVSDLCADHARIAVQTSGGLDSLAVLYHVCRQFPEREVFAVCGDVIDDNGVSTVEVVRSLLLKLNLDARCKLIVTDVNSWIEWPRWSPHGPFRTTVPEAHMAMVAAAKAHDATILLSGDGSDELLASHRFATASVIKELGIRASLSYMKDAGQTGTGILGEFLGLISSVLPVETRLRMYWATNWPEWCRATVSSLIAPRFYEPALTWAEQWLQNALQNHIEVERTWGEAEAFDSWWPQPFFPPADDLCEGSPFMHRDFVAYGLALPLGRRYGPGHRTAYHRFKSLVVDLFEERDQPLLPPHKQYFTKMASSIDSQTIETPLLCDLGIFNKTSNQIQDAATRKLARSVEMWLQGASQRGVQLSY